MPGTLAAESESWSSYDIQQGYWVAEGIQIDLAPLALGTVRLAQSREQVRGSQLSNPTSILLYMHHGLNTSLLVQY